MAINDVRQAVTTEEIAEFFGVDVDVIRRLALAGAITVPVVWHGFRGSRNPLILFHREEWEKLKTKAMKNQSPLVSSYEPEGTDRWRLSGPEYIKTLNKDDPWEEQLPRLRRLVYFIQPATGGLIKIGKTENIDMRMDVFRTQSPVPMRLLAVEPLTKRKGQDTEERLHRHFAPLRRHGEWFQDDGTITDHINSNSCRVGVTLDEFFAIRREVAA